METLKNFCVTEVIIRKKPRTINTGMASINNVQLSTNIIGNDRAQLSNCRTQQKCKNFKVFLIHMGPSIFAMFCHFFQYLMNKIKVQSCQDANFNYLLLQLSLQTHWVTHYKEELLVETKRKCYIGHSMNIFLNDIKKEPRHAGIP